MVLAAGLLGASEGLWGQVGLWGEAGCCPHSPAGCAPFSLLVTDFLLKHGKSEIQPCLEPRCGEEGSLGLYPVRRPASCP